MISNGGRIQGKAQGEEAEKEGEKMDLFNSSSATLSPCGTWRYDLTRRIGDGPTAAIVGVNPSTADAIKDDQTIRKDLGFAARIGWGRIVKINKFAGRATDVRELRNMSDPIGPENDAHIERVIRDCDVLVFAWGPLSKLPRHLRSRWKFLHDTAQAAGKSPLCWGVAKDGHPRHPLMLAYATPLVPWSPQEGE